MSSREMWTYVRDCYKVKMPLKIRTWFRTNIADHTNSEIGICHIIAFLGREDRILVVQEMLAKVHIKNYRTTLSESDLVDWFPYLFPKKDKEKRIEFCEKMIKESSNVVPEKIFIESKPTMNNKVLSH